MNKTGVDPGFAIRDPGIVMEVSLRWADVGKPELHGPATRLAEAMTKLVEGSTEDAEGVMRDVEGSTKLVEGVTRDVEGSAKLVEGVTRDVEGSAKLDEGVTKDVEGWKKLDAGMTKDVEGWKKLDAGMTTDVEGSTKLDAGMTTDVEGSTRLDAGVTRDVEGSTKLDEGVTKDVEGPTPFDGSRHLNGGHPARHFRVAAGRARPIHGPCALASWCACFRCFAPPAPRCSGAPRRAGKRRAPSTRSRRHRTGASCPTAGQSRTTTRWQTATARLSVTTRATWS
jgi:hypothetical protein